MADSHLTVGLVKSKEINKIAVRMRQRFYLL